MSCPPRALLCRCPRASASRVYAATRLQAMFRNLEPRLRDLRPTALVRLLCACVPLCVHVCTVLGACPLMLLLLLLPLPCPVFLALWCAADRQIVDRHSFCGHRLSQQLGVPAVVNSPSLLMELDSPMSAIIPSPLYPLPAVVRRCAPR